MWTLLHIWIILYCQVVKPLLQERTRRKVKVLQGCGRDELLKVRKGSVILNDWSALVRLQPGKSIFYFYFFLTLARTLSMQIMDYASLPHFCTREGSGSSRRSSSGPDDCFSLDHPFHQQLYNYSKQQAATDNLVPPSKQGSFHVDVPEPDPEGIQIVNTIETELHKIGDRRNGLSHSLSGLEIDSAWSCPRRRGSICMSVVHTPQVIFWV